MILKTFLRYKCFGTILTMVPNPFMRLRVIPVIVNITKSLPACFAIKTKLAHVSSQITLQVAFLCKLFVTVKPKLHVS